jgi:hypothetical protein
MNGSKQRPRGVLGGKILVKMTTDPSKVWRPGEFKSFARGEDRTVAINNALSNMNVYGAIRRVGRGEWKITSAGLKKAKKIVAAAA